MVWKLLLLCPKLTTAIGVGQDHNIRGLIPYSVHADVTYLGRLTVWTRTRHVMQLCNAYDKSMLKYAYQQQQQSKTTSWYPGVFCEPTAVSRLSDVHCIHGCSHWG